MIRIPFEDIVVKIKESTDLSEEDIVSKVEAKQAELAGLVSKDGAAHIIANELGVKLIQQGGRQKIKDVFAGMRSVELVGKITQVYDIREFTRQDGGSGKVGSFMIGDETGSIRVAAWGDKADEVNNLQEGMIVMVSDASSKENNMGFKELHLNDRSRIVLNPPGETIGEVKTTSRPEATRKQIKDLVEGDENIELVGTITESFNPRFFEVCPLCNRSAKNATCPQHGEVTPSYSCVFNLILDDGTDNIRVVFFRNQMVRLLDKSADELLTYRQTPDAFEEVRSDLLGQLCKIVGKANRNVFFDRLEFVAQLVLPTPKPEEELARMNQQ
jgi:replication factor A1